MWSTPAMEDPSICTDDCTVSSAEAATIAYPALGWELPLPKEVDFLAGSNNSICCPNPMAQALACRTTGDSQCRNYQLFNYLLGAPGAVDIEFFKEMWRSKPVGKYSNCSIFFAEFNPDSVKSFHCFGPCYPQTYHHAVYDRQIPGQTHSFYEINLTDATPREVAYRAMRTAGEYLGDACFALDGLVQATGIDYQYEPQRQLIAEAQDEFWMGRNYQLSAAKLGSGSEAMALYSKAMTHLTRSMAIAKQAYNGLVGYTYLSPICP
jgi:hypothetical protein